MLNRRFFCMFVIVFGMAITGWAEEPSDIVNEFIGTLFKADGATLSDYDRFSGQGAETELQLFFEFCQQKGWEPPEKHPDCLAFIQNREAHPEQTPSLYLKWLRSKFPVSTPIHIQTVTVYDGSFRYELIAATVGDIKATFFHPLDPDKVVIFGIIDISEIDGIHVSEILKNDIQGEKINWLFEE